MRNELSNRMDSCKRLYSKNIEGFEQLKEREVKSTENMIWAYDLDQVQTKIDAWLFEIIEPDQTDEHFWNTEAERILNLDPKEVKLNGESFTF